MTGFWILILIFSTMYTVQRGRCCCTAESLTESPVYQPDKKLSVDIGDSATLRCCISENTFGIIAWFKQANRNQPQIMVTIFIGAGEAFYSESQNLNFQIKRSSNCFIMTLLKTTQSDEAMYYCTLTTASQFGDGTYLKMKGENVTTASETSVPALYDNSVVFEPTPHEKSINMNTQQKTVLGLGSSLGVCALLIFSLIYFILRRKNIENSRVKAFMKHPVTRQDSDGETLNYAAVQFIKTEAKDERRKDDSSDECVTEVIYNTIR